MSKEHKDVIHSNTFKSVTKPKDDNFSFVDVANTHSSRSQSENFNSVSH